jgi:hypothetical protein
MGWKKRREEGESRVKSKWKRRKEERKGTIVL